jgi:hypothetical protein
MNTNKRTTRNIGKGFVCGLDWTVDWMDVSAENSLIPMSRSTYIKSSDAITDLGGETDPFELGGHLESGLETRPHSYTTVTGRGPSENLGTCSRCHGPH